MKSSLAGDENDYIREYRRRYPTFPQEGTLDQFFSEEQFEAYRALGFHMVHAVFTGADCIQAPDEKRDAFIAFAETILQEELGCSGPFLWSGKAVDAAA